ncbi:tyrosine-type recombinase/integrase [Waterburya agarophytonicola K14]|uniref:Tyrosine-type recombinase/integrase n=1 Tax=Waterburya agarophytonicola KI4 TaxID=2874699 RepID=A0A964FFP1_9CYAN|nr:tyrosine-type recombinase/integrase [Waterburya agarophytonicola KI4]
MTEVPIHRTLTLEEIQEAYQKYQELLKSNTSKASFEVLTKKYPVSSRTLRRYWNTVVKGLMIDGKLEKKYRNYSLRHSFITRLVRSGEDIATIARISGNSTETIVNFYLSAKKNGFDIPEL